MPKKKQSTNNKKEQPVPQPRPFEARWADAVDFRRILNISRTTLYKWENKLNLLVASELGGKKYYDLEALNKRLVAGLKKKGKKP